jgi:hypothetical protein
MIFKVESYNECIEQMDISINLAEVFEVLMLQSRRKHAFTAPGVQFDIQIQPEETERGLLHTLAAIQSLFSRSLF